MKLWPYFLGVWLILTGLDKVANLSFKYESLAMGIIALVTGVLVIMRK